MEMYTKMKAVCPHTTINVDKGSTKDLVRLGPASVAATDEKRQLKTAVYAIGGPKLENDGSVRILK